MATRTSTPTDENWYVVEWNAGAGKANIKAFPVQTVRKMLGSNWNRMLNRNSDLAWIPVGLFRTMEEATQFSVAIHRIWLSRHPQEKAEDTKI